MKKETPFNAYNKAKRRVDNLRSFYGHLIIYLIVNVIITFVKLNRNLANGETLNEAFFDFATFGIWIVWGIGLVIHAFGVFGLPLILGKNWEEKKIEEYIKQDQEHNYNSYE